MPFIFLIFRFSS